jgi:hypothetical protein
MGKSRRRMNILFLTHSGTNSRDIMTDVVAGFREAGHFSMQLPVDAMFRLAYAGGVVSAPDRERLIGAVGDIVRENAVELIVSMWGNGVLLLGDVARQAAGTSTTWPRIGAPILNIWLDSPERAHQGSVVQLFRTAAFSSPWVFNHINNDASAAEMAQIYGFSNVLPTPWGVNPTIFKPWEEPRTLDVMFSIGGGEPWTKPTPAMLEEVARDEPDVERIRKELAEAVRPRLRTLAESLGDAASAACAVFERMLQMQLADRTKPMVARLTSIATEDASLRRGVEAIVRDLTGYVAMTELVRQVDSFHRVFSFVHLARHFRCGLFGAGDLEAWGCAVRSEGNVPYAEQAKQYSRASVGLSVMRWQDEAGLHIKPYEITASGAACIAQHRSGLDAQWAIGSEVETFVSLPELRRKVHHLVSDASVCEAMARAGRARTLRDHTWSRRAAVLTGVIEHVQSASMRS